MHLKMKNLVVVKVYPSLRHIPIRIALPKLWSWPKTIAKCPLLCQTAKLTQTSYVARFSSNMHLCISSWTKSDELSLDPVHPDESSSIWHYWYTSNKGFSVIRNEVRLCVR